MFALARGEGRPGRSKLTRSLCDQTPKVYMLLRSSLTSAKIAIPESTGTILEV